MANGFTGCIDLERLRKSCEILNVVENYINNRDLTEEFIDIEEMINNINFEHGSCITNYKDSINNIYDTISEIKQEITLLRDNLNTTITNFSKIDNISKDDLMDLSDIYKNTLASRNINNSLNSGININISNNIEDFSNNIDDSIKNFMVKSNIKDYPNNYSSEAAWRKALNDKYSSLNISDNDRENLIDKDMSIWRQERTGSKVTSIATSEVAERESNINNLASRYMNKYNMDKNDADVLARLKDEFNQAKLSHGTVSEFNSISDRLSVIENKYNINLRKSIVNSVDNAISNGTSDSYNTIPIGLGIAAAGISGSVGAVIVDGNSHKKHRYTKNGNYEDNSDELNLEGDYVSNDIPQDTLANSTNTSLPDFDMNNNYNKIYHANRNKEDFNKFYDDTDDFFYKDDDER